MNGNIFDLLEQQVKRERPAIVFPEGLDERILRAASKLSLNNSVKPVLIGDEEKIFYKSRELGLTFGEVELLNPRTYKGIERMTNEFVARRKGKETTESAREKLLDENYFGTMLVYLDIVDGLVSGAVHPTSDTVRPALQIIKTEKGISKTSGVFLMVKGEQKFLFADCAINIAPNAEELAEIAVNTAKTAKLFGIEPRVAILSFSTKGSASSIETRKVAEATEAAKKKRPDIVIDGELQFDAAFIPAVARKKAPDSPLEGNANVFIFPSLEAGNLGYKIAQRLGGYEAIGPILQGLNRPVNDLSRGCTAEDVYKLALITAMQSIQAKVYV